MGLTVHFELQSRVKTVERARELTRQMRHAAFQLPFETVGPIVEIHGDECILPLGWLQDGPPSNPAARRRWDLARKASIDIPLPWNHNRYETVWAEHAFSFNVWPGEGCESCDISLAKLPDEIELTYCRSQDARFETYAGWSRNKKKYPRHEYEQRKVKPPYKSWRGSDFCKTIYASNVSELHFVKCHVMIVTLLERINRMQGVQVSLHDEGNYGCMYSRSVYDPVSGEYRDPETTRDPPQHDVDLLVRQNLSEEQATFFDWQLRRCERRAGIGLVRRRFVDCEDPALDMFLQLASQYDSAEIEDEDVQEAPAQGESAEAPSRRRILLKRGPAAC